MRSLHVAALPFPSPQGTQAAVRSMLDACASERGSDAHLLVYAHGAGALEGARFTLHRAAGRRSFDGDVPARALRSGPSLGKLAHDVALAVELRRLTRALRPRVVVAHHVEACAAALLAGARPLVFVAHTALAPELPAYAPEPTGTLLSPLLSRAGGALDRALCRRADAVAAVGPALAARLSASAGVAVQTLALPWRLPSPLAQGERSAARAALGFVPTDEVVLYAGNLDRYQGLPLALAALAEVARRRPRLRVLIATESPREELDGALRAVGLAARVVFASLGTEEARRRAHAAAELALVPRALPGGVPVKLLDALARAVPVVAQRRALGGLALPGALTVCADDDAEALAAAVVAVLADPNAAGELGQRRRSYVAREHSDARFLGTLAAVEGQALDAARRRRK
jgi:glycosyltransferase involved in cell wall biosynthesis